MANEIKEQIQTLGKLQDIESQMDALIAELQKIPIQQGKLDQSLSEIDQLMDEDRKTLDRLQKSYRAAEDDVQTNLDMMAKSKEKARVVKTNKEYQSTLKEIDEIKKKNSRLEDDMLATLDDIEALQGRIADREGEYENLSRDIGLKKEKIEADAEGERKILEDLGKEKSAIMGTLDKGIIDQYTSVRSRLGKLAVAKVASSICQGCHMNIPPQLYNELQRFEKIIFCPNCHRIIYWDDKRPE
jgi:predicted  nucleic acid-binding Zn-ribbon protein